MGSGKPAKSDAAGQSGLGFVLWKQGRTDDASAAFRAAIASDPDHLVAYDHLGTLLAEQGEHEEAAEHFRTLVRKRPSAANHEKLARVLAALGRHDEARLEREKAARVQRR